MLTLQMFNEMDNLHREMDQLFKGLGLAPAFETRSLVPRFKLADAGEAFTVAASLPGIDGGSLEITVVGRRLTISGERVASEVPEDAVWHRRERNTGSFEQSLSLPEQVDTAKVEAEYKNGALLIRLPKSAEALPKKIVVKAA